MIIELFVGASESRQLFTVVMETYLLHTIYLESMFATPIRTSYFLCHKMFLRITEDLEETEDEGRKGSELRITKDVLKKHCVKDGLYSIPHLNDVLYLHYKGYRLIENLDEYTGLKCIWLDHNNITKIQKLDHLQNLKSLYLHNNAISTIENIASLRNLNTINLSHNRISKLKQLDSLPNLVSLYMTNNYLTTIEDIAVLRNCCKLAIVDLSANKLNGKVIDVFEEMASLKVLYLVENPIQYMKDYRRMFIKKCKHLTHLDKEAVFKTDRQRAVSDGTNSPHTLNT